MKINQKEATKNRPIVAVASGFGAIGIVRLSGCGSIEIAKELFFPKSKMWKEPSYLHYGSFAFDADVDDGYCVYFKSPNSFTGEDSVEFYLHGNALNLNEVVKRCVLKGAVLAKPGEFSQKAFLNGKIDLVQADAICELIVANNELEMKMARQRLSSQLSKYVLDMYNEVIDVFSFVQADIDFPDEALPIEKNEVLKQRINNLILRSKKLIQDYDITSGLSKGFEIVLVGRPNVGKSSLFNALINSDKAIVSNTPGTTRDVVECQFQLDSINVILKDTAGLRENTQDSIEMIGIEKTKTEISNASLIIWVLSAPDGLTSDDQLFKSALKNKNVIRVWNKRDLKTIENELCVSTKTMMGMDVLKEKILQHIKEIKLPQTAFGLGNDRQRRLLEDFALNLTSAIEVYNDGAEFAAMNIKSAIENLACILGKNEPGEDLLDSIFSKFCIGK